MTFTADQYLQVAAGYDEAAGDPAIASAKREAFSRKANWFRFLAERERRTFQLRQPANDVSQTVSSEPLPASGRSLRPFLTTLWLTGAVIYLIGTVLFANTITDFFRSETSEQTDVSQQLRSPSASERKKEAARLQPGLPAANPTEEARHAITPNQPAYEAPSIMVPPSAPEASQDPTSRDPLTQASAPARSDPEVLRVVASATIRNGSSPDSRVIGTARPGAELQVKAREQGWVEFIDPESGNSGWIESYLLMAPSSRDEISGTPETSVEARSSTPYKQKAVKSRIKKKPSGATEITKQLPDRPSSPARNRARANLPDDEAFINTPPPRRGFLAKRRMLRQGLLSPDFIPPR
jgi:hypothetical protein